MGGAKRSSLPHRKHPKTEHARAMGAFVDTFDGAYIAAEDVGVDTQFIVDGSRNFPCHGR